MIFLPRLRRLSALTATATVLAGAIVASQTWRQIGSRDPEHYERVDAAGSYFRRQRPVPPAARALEPDVVEIDLRQGASKSRPRWSDPLRTPGSAKK